MQEIIVLLLILTAVFFIGRHLVKEYRGKQCDDCGLQQSASKKE